RPAHGSERFACLVEIAVALIGTGNNKALPGSPNAAHWTALGRCGNQAFIVACIMFGVIVLGEQSESHGGLHAYWCKVFITHEQVAYRVDKAKNNGCRGEEI